MRVREGGTLTAKAEQRNGGSGNTLASSVYGRMRHDILCGDLGPGDRLRADFLRARYEVGTSPVREALNRLAAEGLVVHEDQRGFHVSAVSRDRLEELIKTRCWMEDVALRQSIANGDTAWEEAIVLAFFRLSRVPQSADDATFVMNPEWERLHRDYHRTLIANCGSLLLIGFCEQLRDQADRYRLLAVGIDYPRRNEVEEHREIMEATIGRDADTATGLLTAHFRNTVDIILSLDSPLTATASGDANA